jgi:DNA-binding GntR family transcriptional regulator
MIEAGELSPGEWVNEAMIAARLGVSRGPVREACRGLEQSGLLDVIVNRGSFVRQVDAAGAADLYDLRAALLALAARTLAGRISKAALAELRRLVDEMDRAIGSAETERYYATNLAFHRALVTLSGNARLAASYLRFIQELHLFRRRALVAPERMLASNQEHRAILAAVGAGDADRAEVLAKAHVLDAKARALNPVRAGADQSP